MAKKPLLVHLDPDLFDWLRAEAERLNVSLGEVVRWALRDRKSGLVMFSGAGPPVLCGLEEIGK